MRILFYFLPVLTTRAGVNKYGVPQRDQKTAASPPLKSVILPTNRSMSPSSAYFTSNIAGKQIGISCGSGRRNCFHWETDENDGAAPACEPISLPAPSMTR
jgi:hypothetical protein